MGTEVARELDHERSGASCLIVRRFLGLSWDHFFVGLLVFVILTFFKEGIGNNLTMPSWVLGLELELGLGNGSWEGPVVLGESL